MSKTNQPMKPSPGGGRAAMEAPSLAATAEGRAILEPLLEALDEAQALANRASPGVRAAVAVLAASLAAVQAGERVVPDVLRAELRQVAAEIVAGGAGADPAARATMSRLMRVVASVGPGLVGLTAHRRPEAWPVHPPRRARQAPPPAAPAKAKRREPARPVRARTSAWCKLVQRFRRMRAAWSGLHPGTA